MTATRSIVGLIDDGTLDADLAALLWIMMEGRVPLIVASDDERTAATSELIEACLGFLPAAVRVVELAGDAETFSWLPQASELGWPGASHPVADGKPVRPDTTVLRAAALVGDRPTPAGASVARIAVRAASIGYGLVTSIRAASLEAVLATLQAPPIALSEDECSHLGIVSVVGRVPDGRERVTAAHYVRPLARDVHGHLQRLGPAVLTTWDATTDTFEHFGWGVAPELARRVARHAGDLEIEQERRRDYLIDLAAAGTTDPQPVLDALGNYRPAEAIDAPG
jgi:hypothetical protein